MNLPNEIIESIQYEAARHSLSNVDNFRAYRANDRVGRAEFLAVEEKGCCGSWEGSTVIDGVKWIIGCNYGH